jgi:ornithine cyclodeaminase
LTVWSPTATHRQSFGERARATLAGDTDVRVCADLRAATAEAAVVTLATRSEAAVLDSEDVGRDVHVNSIGAIAPGRREVDSSYVESCRTVVADDPAAALRLSGDLVDRHDIAALGDVVAAPDRRQPGRSLFKAMGLGAADVALGAEVLTRCRDADLGQPIPRPGTSTLSLSRRKP